MWKNIEQTISKMFQNFSFLLYSIFYLQNLSLNRYILSILKIYVFVQKFVVQELRGCVIGIRKVLL